MWHALGAKATELINEHVHLELIRGDLETPVLDADVLEDLLLDPDLKKTKEVELKIAFRLRKHRGDPRFVALGERLEELRERHEQGQLSSLEFLKSLLELARDVVGAEKEVEPEEEIDSSAELFQSVENEDTTVLVERVVAEIDEIVRQVPCRPVTSARTLRPRSGRMKEHDPKGERRCRSSS